MINKIKFIALLFLGFALTQCKDIENPNEEQLKKDKVLMDKYITDNNLRGTYILDGIYKSILSTGPVDSVAKTGEGLLLGYRLRLLDGALIDSTVTFYQHNQRFFPDGIEVALGTMREGEYSTFVFSSVYAYGSQVAQGKSGTVPPNSPVVMETRLFDIIPKSQVVDAFAKFKNLQGQKTTSGVFYKINEAGTGDTARLGNTLTVKYKGYLLNGFVFDEGSAFQFVLGKKSVIQGWEDVFQLLKKGDKATIIIPSSLAYGINGSRDSRGKYIIPPDAVIAFDVELLNIQ